MRLSEITASYYKMMNISLRLTFPTVALVATILILAGCKPGEEASRGAPEVEVVAVKQKDVPIYRDWVGTLEADVNATISAQVTGYLVSRNYTEGSLVKKGQLLFQIDDRTYKAALDQAEAKVTKTEQDVTRYTPLAKAQAISQQELDNAIQANIAAKAAAEQARLNYQFCRITSPVDGLAGLAQAQVGNLVGPSTGTLTTVTTVDPMRANFSVSQELMTQMQERRLARGEVTGRSGEGAELELIFPSGATYSPKGRLRFANNQINVKTGTVTVVGEFPNPQLLLVPGMFVRVRALIDTAKNALVVPQRAVTDMQGRDLIAVVDGDNKVSIRPVQVGERVGEEWIIKGNIKAGDKVVAEGIQKVRDGGLVKPVPFAAKATTPVAGKNQEP